MAYTGQLPKDMIPTEPQIGTARVNELDDAIRQVKAALLYGYDNTTFGSGNTAIASGTAIYVRTGSGTAYLTLPQLSGAASSGVPRKLVIFNDTATSGSGGALTLSAYSGDTMSNMETLWQNESVELIGTTTDNEWKVTKLKQEHTIDATIAAAQAAASAYADSASANAYSAAVASASAMDNWILASAVTSNTTTTNPVYMTLPACTITEILASTYSESGGAGSNSASIQKYINGVWITIATATTDEAVQAVSYYPSVLHSDGTNIRTVHTGHTASRSNGIYYKKKT